MLKPYAVQVILPDWFPVTMEEAVIFLQKMEEAADGISLILYNPPHAKKRLNPFTAQKWYNLIRKDMEAGLELESRINVFMKKFIEPLITEHHYPNHACDRFMAVLGGWADVGEKLRWPYKSVPREYADEIRKEAQTVVPEFFEKF